MSALIKIKQVSVFVPPICQQVRHRKPFIPKVKPGPWERRIIMAVSAPLFPLPKRPPSLVCSEKRKVRALAKIEVNPYEVFVVRQCQKMMASQRIIAVYQELPMSQEERKLIRNKLFKKGYHMAQFGNHVIRQAITDTRFANMEVLLSGRNCFIISEQTDISEMLKITRKEHQLHLLGGFVEDRLLTKEGMMWFASLPNIDTLRAHLLATLNSAAGKTHSLLNSHQQSLSGNLERYIKLQSDDSDTGDKSSTEPS